MAYGDTAVTLETQPGGIVLAAQSFAQPGITIHTPVAVELELVTGLALPDSESYQNPRHSPHVDTISPDRDNGPNQATITLPSEKAERLAAVFAGLRPGHQMDCSDFVDAVEGWETDRGHYNCSQALFENDEAIEDGLPYRIMSSANGGDNPACSRVYSFFGTEKGQALGILGIGSILAILSPQDAIRAYSPAGKGYFSRAFSPNLASDFPDHVVPYELSFTEGFSFEFPEPESR